MKGRGVFWFVGSANNFRTEKPTKFTLSGSVGRVHSFELTPGRVGSTGIETHSGITAINKQHVKKGNI